MATYQTCGDDITEMVKKLTAANHMELALTGVTVSCLYAYASQNAATGEPTGPAIKFAGWPAAAIVRINSLKDRVEGKSDATIVIDGDTWKTRPEPEQLALLDHELQHLEVRRTKPKKRKVNGKTVQVGGGDIILDDVGRPKLKLRPHDWQLGGFDAIVRRHKGASLDYQEATDLSRRFTQQEFNWG